MAFPITARYFLRFRHSDTGLTPTFNYFKRTDTLVDVTPPVIEELAGGTYYFDYEFLLSTSPDIVFEVDGGNSIPTEEVRYISDTISPRDHFLDEPISQVKTDVWSDNTVYSAGQKGKRVDQLGDPADASSSSTLFGKTLLYKEAVRGDSAGTSDGDAIDTARDRIMGGTGYGGTGVDMKTVNDKVGTSSDSSAIATLFGKALLYKESVRGDSAGTSDGNSLKQVYDRVGLPDTTTISADIAALQATADTLESRVGQYTNVYTDPTVFGQIYATRVIIRGVDSRDNTEVYNKVDAIDTTVSGLEASLTTVINDARDSVKGADLRTLTELAGSGFSTTTDTLKSIKGSVAGLVSPDNAGIAAIKLETDKIGDAANSSGDATVFGRVYSSRDAVMGDPAATIQSVRGTGFSSAVNSLKALTDGPIARILGMMHENSVLDLTEFDLTSNNLTAGRLRSYTTKADADAATALALAHPGEVTTYDTNKLAQYAIRATYDGSNLTTYEVTKEFPL